MMEMSKRNIKAKQARDEPEWSSDEEYRGTEQEWRSENEWNEDSSMAGEASVMSEGTEEEQPEEEREEIQKQQEPKKYRRTKPTTLNLDDVGTEDDGESRHPEDITERTDEIYSKTNASDISDMSDIEEQIEETQNKFMDDKQSLSRVMGLVDEVTKKGENLTKKASHTSLVVERDTFKKGPFSNDQLSLFDDDEISFRSYTDRLNLEDDHIPQRDLGKMTAGSIEYINYGKKEARNGPKQALGLGQIEYLDETKSNDSGSLISDTAESSASANVDNGKEDIGEEKSKTTETLNIAESDNQPSDAKSDRPSMKSTQSSETLISRISNQEGAEESDSDSKNDECMKDDECIKEEDDEPNGSEQELEDEDRLPHSNESKQFEDPECSKFGEKHLCCFINLGGGGDDGRENELVNRLKKLKDDIADMRKELSLARQECKKESEEVAKLIEAATARNKAAEQNEIALLQNSTNMLSTYSSPNYAQEIVPTGLLSQNTVAKGRTQVAVPTALLEDRLRATRQNASSTYRESLNELERMVEKEMASIKDSMIRLEPLNKIAAEWDAVLPIRDPTRTTYKSDYKLEMVTSEMRLQAPGSETRCNSGH